MACAVGRGAALEPDWRGIEEPAPEAEQSAGNGCAAGPDWLCYTLCCIICCTGDRGAIHGPDRRREARMGLCLP